MSRGLITVTTACVLLFAASGVFASSSVSQGALLGMLPFAAVLAIVALGQTLVIQQGGIDLSVVGAVSIVVVITTRQAAGEDSKLFAAVLMALGVAALAGLANGFLIGRLGLNPIVATLGTDTLLMSGVFAISGGIPRTTTDLMAKIGGGLTLGIPNSVYFAVGITIVTTTVVKHTQLGRRFEAVGANPMAMFTTGAPIQRHRVGAYFWAQMHYWLGGVLLAGIVTEPTAFQGRAYLLPSVAAVVLGGTSLLGGKGNLVATAVAALFLTQLVQFALALGVGFASRTLVQAAALTVGIALYTIDWRAVAARLKRPTADESPPNQLTVG
ncbi:MAG: ABC transporter permease [Acidimicrobiia bacterium]|nr:ABC transporter permease [Acidimicrobiia bacterium]